jgi:hypothetical protein
VDLDRGIFATPSEIVDNPKVQLSTHLAKMLKTQSTMIELHKQRIMIGDKEHTEKSDSVSHTVFETGSYVLLDPASGKPKSRLHSRKAGPYKVVGHEFNTYTLFNLVSKKEFRVNIKRLHPFFFDENRVNPQEVAAFDEEEFLVESIMDHRGNFNQKGTLEFKVRWLGYAPSEDTWEPWRSIMHVDKLHEYLISIGKAMLVPKPRTVTRST